MASYETMTKLAQNPHWIPPRSDLRVFLGEPGAPKATKTTVEPGNVFSPGMMSFGVTWWLHIPESDLFFATETAPLGDLCWSYEQGYLPVIQCRVDVAGLDLLHTLFQDGTAAERSEAVCAQLEIHNKGAEALQLQVFVALRSLGPAGGEVKSLSVGPDGRSIWNNERKLPLLGADVNPSAIGCGVGDPSPMAIMGHVPAEQQASDQEGWCFGLLRFDLSLQPSQDWKVAYDCPLQSVGPVQDLLGNPVQPRPAEFNQRREIHKSAWKAQFGQINIETPDKDFNNAFFAGVQHLLTAMVGEQARITPLAYPLPWLRDSVFIVRCLDLAGFHAQARAATNYIARNDFFGGFGAEGDAPGEGVWALVQHYRITRDKGWLEHIYPDILRKVNWLRRMRQAKQPIQVLQDAPTLAFTHAQRTTGIICLPAKDGLIQGTMDFGVDYSLGWVNHWAVCGLREAAYAADELGSTEDMARFSAEAEDLLAALRSYAAANPPFFDYERTTNSLLWPTRAWADDLDAIREQFDTWWLKNRGDPQNFIPEPYWLYFEESQAHNALLLGQRQHAWQALDYRLRHQDLPGLCGWREGGQGVGTQNAAQGVTLIPFLRGCQKFESITPHGWSQAEMWLLQRAILVEEWQNGLLLFAGVPAHWLTPGACVAFSNLPTWYGQVNASLEVDEDGQGARVTVSGIEVGTSVKVSLPGWEGQFTMEGQDLMIGLERTW